MTNNSHTPLASTSNDGASSSVIPAVAGVGGAVVIILILVAVFLTRRSEKQDQTSTLTSTHTMPLMRGPMWLSGYSDATSSSTTEPPSGPISVLIYSGGLFPHAHNGNVPGASDQPLFSETMLVETTEAHSGSTVAASDLGSVPRQANPMYESGLDDFAYATYAMLGGIHEDDMFRMANPMYMTSDYATNTEKGAYASVDEYMETAYGHYRGFDDLHEMESPYAEATAISEYLVTSPAGE